MRVLLAGFVEADDVGMIELAQDVDFPLKALEEAGAIILRGGNPSLVIDNYQKIVAANAARLSGV